MNKKEQLIETLDDFRFWLKYSTNISVIEQETSIDTQHQEVFVGNKKIATLPVTKEYNIRFVVRD